MNTTVGPTGAPEAPCPPPRGDDRMRTVSLALAALAVLTAPPLRAQEKPAGRPLPRRKPTSQPRSR